MEGDRFLMTVFEHLGSDELELSPTLSIMRTSKFPFWFNSVWFNPVTFNLKRSDSYILLPPEHITV